MEKGKQVESVKATKIRITLTSRNVPALEKVCTEVKAKAGQDVKVRGPRRMPTKVLRITTRKSPCGEGTNTWDRFEMRIHKRVLDLESTENILSKLNKLTLEPGVQVEVSQL
eukprot:TRINITY_DN10757_c0_g1_i1.p1 TRINITY_DN10757_c0_g1~~TRINITY_DN10757_c0_g1_i1.p1  ORF type:complete len:123 (-),score=9.67 TRINITY_DN10757_c0_g1_i1:109-444(-)